MLVCMSLLLDLVAWLFGGRALLLTVPVLLNVFVFSTILGAEHGH